MTFLRQYIKVVSGGIRSVSQLQLLFYFRSIKDDRDKSYFEHNQRCRFVKRLRIKIEIPNLLLHFTKNKDLFGPGKTDKFDAIVFGLPTIIPGKKGWLRARMSDEVSKLFGLVLKGTTVVRFSSAPPLVS